MTVWITRSEPGASRQARVLEAAGYRCLIAPVLDIEALPGAAPVGPFDFAIFVSEHAVAIGLPRVALGAARIFAVGARTAAVLAAAGQAAEHPERADTEGLLALPALGDVAGRRILLVCGVGGRPVLAETLTERGAMVERFACYRRRARQRLPAGPGFPSAVRAIIVGSADALTSVARIWFGADGAPDVPLLVPSDRVRTSGLALGFRNVHDCRGADVEAVLRGLAEVAPTGTT